MTLARPLPWLTGALVLGTLAGLDAARGDGGAALGALVAAALLVGWLRRGRPTGRLAWVPRAAAFLALLGLVRGWVAEPRVVPGGAGAPPEVRGDVVGRARDVPIVGRWRSLGVPGGARGWVEPAERAPELPALPGHRILFDLEAPAPDEGAWVAILPGGDVTPWPRGPVPGRMARDGRFLASARVAPDELVRLEGGKRLDGRAGGLREAIARGRRWLRQRARTLERPGPSEGLVRALVAGDRSGLPPGRSDLFTRTGTRHLLALSGLHVGLFFALFLVPSTALLLRLPFPRDPARRRAGVTALRVGLVVLYAVVVGAGDPVTRASMALVLARLARFVPVRDGGRGRTALGRRPDGLSMWSCALLLECLAAPAGLRAVSLQLSYAATLGLILGTGPIAAWLLPAGAGTLPEAGVHTVGASLRAIVRRSVARPAARALGASAAAVLATLPIVWSTFGEWSPLGVVVTPLSLPLLALLIVVSWSGVLVPALACPALIGRLSAGLLGLLELADRLPGTPDTLPGRPVVLVGLAVVATFLACTGTAPRLWRAALLLWAALALPWSAAPAGLELFALDVGHGSALVLRAPGLPALVFDAGSRDRRALYEEALAPLLARWEVAHAWIALSHDHVDHRSALGRLVERTPPTVFLGARAARLTERLPHATLCLDAAPGRDVLLPVPRGSPLSLAWLRGVDGAGNEGSRSLAVRWRGAELLLSGDAEAEGLAGILAGNALHAPLRLLLYPHHGSDSPLLARLLGRTRPAETWVSAGSAPAIAAELDRRGLAWRWTGRDGPLALFLP